MILWWPGVSCVIWCLAVEWTKWHCCSDSFYMIDWLKYDWSIDLLIDWLIDWWIDWLSKQSADWCCLSHRSLVANDGLRFRGKYSLLLILILFIISENCIIIMHMFLTNLAKPHHLQLKQPIIADKYGFMSTLIMVDIDGYLHFLIPSIDCNIKHKHLLCHHHHHWWVHELRLIFSSSYVIVSIPNYFYDLLMKKIHFNLHIANYFPRCLGLIWPP